MKEIIVARAITDTYRDEIRCYIKDVNLYITDSKEGRFETEIEFVLVNLKDIDWVVLGDVFVDIYIKECDNYVYIIKLISDKISNIKRLKLSESMFIYSIKLYSIINIYTINKIKEIIQKYPKLDFKYDVCTIYTPKRKNVESKYYPGTEIHFYPRYELKVYTGRSTIFLLIEKLKNLYERIKKLKKSMIIIGTFIVAYKLYNMFPTNELLILIIAGILVELIAFHILGIKKS